MGRRPLSGVVLAGGRSTLVGADKRAVELLRKVAGDPIIVTRDHMGRGRAWPDKRLSAAPPLIPA